MATRIKIKVYLVPKADAEGGPTGEVLAAKLRHADAHAIARERAPSKVLLLVAD